MTIKEFTKLEIKRKKNNLLFNIIKFFKKGNYLFSYLLLLIYTLIIFIIGIYVHDNGITAKYIKPLITNGYKIPRNFISGLFSKTENIYIDIKHNDFEKIVKKRNELLLKSVKEINNEDYVSAHLTYNNKKVKIDIRLKGDVITNFIGTKWSYRIKVKGENTILGMKKFSLHKPEQKNNINEWLYHKILSQNNIIFLRYDFFNLIINW